MKFIADFHIHSHYSMATSKQLIPEYLDYWAGIKGITLVGSGDFTHPGWLGELKEKLEPTEPGLFKLKPGLKNDPALQPPFLPDREVRFILTAEISSIYKKKGKVRKVHNVIFAPGFEAAEKFQQKLTAMGGNITSDGRPILGLDSRDLLEMSLEVSERNFFIPAHIWTPWFSVLGDKSGFESIEECFDDLSGHIHAVETGLSSDPPMNWMCGFLDRFTLISNSDAHSPEKLGRNANRFDCELTYDAVVSALKGGEAPSFLGTIDLFPQEGKYHYDGHRKCGVCWDPVSTLKHRGLCPGCGKPVTVGVMNRVVKISDRENLEDRPNRAPFASIIPLKEILGEILGAAPTTRKVDKEYFSLVKQGCPELYLLLDMPVPEIADLGHEQLAEAVRRMRAREVHVTEGYDGEFGRVKVFAEGEDAMYSSQQKLFSIPGGAGEAPVRRRGLVNFDLEEYRRLAGLREQEDAVGEAQAVVPAVSGLNFEQQQAALHYEGPVLILAGPGTGKTRVLAHRVAHLVLDKGIPPGHILAVTFTNKAAGEMKERLAAMLPGNDFSGQLTVTTFHSLGLSILKELAAPDRGDGVSEILGRGNGFSLVDEEDRKNILHRHLGCKHGQLSKISGAITTARQELKSPGEIEDREIADLLQAYENFLKTHNLFDLDDLVSLPAGLLAAHPHLAEGFREKYPWILVDEYQDINYAQYRLLRALAPGVSPNLCVIGDPDQAIYGFRGADVGFINRFLEDFPGAGIYRLKKSYRCSESILHASGDVLGKDKNPGEFLEGVDKGVKIRILGHPTHKSEAEFVARTIEGMMGGLRFFSMDSSITAGHREEGIESLSDFAVLCRVRGQMEALMKAFNDHSIPYQAVGDGSFFSREPVKSLVDALKLIHNPQNSYLALRLLDREGIDAAGLAEMKNRIAPVSRVREALSLLAGRYFNTREGEPGPEVQRLLELSGDFGADREGFLRFAALGTGIDTYRPGLEGVSLLTLHAAKGLEFSCVFVVGCEEGLLPYSLFESRDCDREEERRLLYVGMTRARKYLFLTHADKRFFKGREYRLKRSPFLDRIEKQLIDWSRLEQKRKKKEDFTQPSLFDHLEG